MRYEYIRGQTVYYIPTGTAAFSRVTATRPVVQLNRGRMLLNVLGTPQAQRAVPAAPVAPPTAHDISPLIQLVEEQPPEDVVAQAARAMVRSSMPPKPKREKETADEMATPPVARHREGPHPPLFGSAAPARPRPVRIAPVAATGPSLLELLEQECPSVP